MENDELYYIVQGKKALVFYGHYLSTVAAIKAAQDVKRITQKPVQMVANRAPILIIASETHSKAPNFDGRASQGELPFSWQ